MDNNVERNPIGFLEKSFCQLQFVIHFTLLIGYFFEKPNLPQNMRVIRLSAFDNFEFDNRDHHFWYSLTQGFPKIYHTYGVSWIFEKPNLPQNMGVIRLSAFDNFEFDNWDHHF